VVLEYQGDSRPYSIVHSEDREIVEMTTAKNGFRDIDSRDFFTQGDNLRHWIPSLVHLALSSGDPIRAMDHSMQGRMGLHIALKGQPGRYGLTCRHVMLSDFPTDIPYRHERQGTGKNIIQTTEKRIVETLEVLRRLRDSQAASLAELLEILARQDAAGKKVNAKFRDSRADTEQNIDQLSYIIEYVEEMPRDKDRMIGHVASTAPAHSSNDSEQ
jgi:hypothetical protein